MATPFGLDNPQGSETPVPVRRDRKPVFKLFIACSTVLLLTATIRFTDSGGYLASVVWYKVLTRTKGGTAPSIEQSVRDREEILNLQLDREAVHLARTVASVFDASAEPVREFRRLAGLAPLGSPDESIFIAKGINLTYVGFLSGRVFMEDVVAPVTLPYVLRPNVQAIWIGTNHPIAIRELLMLPLLPDDPKVREAAKIELAGRPHTTNSWGLRGPEPDPDAPIRIMVLGDSFMHGFGVADDDTPPMFLQRHLADMLQEPVYVLNAGLSGYGPKEYYLSLEKFADRFNPHVVVVSVCSNDFGANDQVHEPGGGATGKTIARTRPGRTASLLRSGDDWQRAAFYLEKIRSVCKEREIPCLFCPVPEAEFMRQRNASYTDRLAQTLHASSLELLSTLDAFTTENLRILQERRSADGDWTDRSFLHLEDEGDGHLNPRGADLWGKEVGERVTALIKCGHAHRD